MDLEQPLLRGQLTDRIAPAPQLCYRMTEIVFVPNDVEQEIAVAAGFMT
jgi:hypothetical protein